MAEHRNWFTTVPCNCPWDKGAGLVKEAGKLHDFLMNPKSRPDLQTPEAQDFLKRLGQNYWSEKTDPLMPWLTREWKKGRVGFRERVPGDTRNPDPNLWHTNPSWPKETDPQAEQLNHGRYIRPIERGGLEHIADWYHSNAPNRQGHDIMKSTAWDVQQEKIPEWESWMAEQAKKKDFEAAKGLGRVLHSYDDGWTVRQLPADALEYEGWAMRGKPTNGYPEGVPICVGDSSYQHAVHNGDSAVVSLRDPTGQPHITAEITPYTGMGDDNGSYEWPDGFEQILKGDPIIRATGPDFKNRLREIDEMHRDSPHHMLHELGDDLDDETTRAGLNPGDGGNPFHVYRVLRDRRAHYIPSLEKGTIEQIQGKGNTVPKDEYQQRMKEWFQTYPEALRPNWTYADDDIDHIGALVPDAESWDADHGVIDGDPNHEYGGHGLGHGDQGGYGPHGDYGLVGPPELPIDYGGVLNSLVRPRYWRDEDQRYDEHEGRALYDEAKKRGQIPQLAKSLEAYHDHAMGIYDNHRDMNYDYYPQYPGESWDEDRERWLYDENGEQRTPEEAQEAFSDARSQYENGEEEALQNVPQMQAASHMYKLINPHYDASQQAYVNEEQPQPPEQTVAKVAAFRLYSNKDVKPAYYRWVYSPANGDVDLAHNWRNHPAEISYHAQMAADRNEPGLVHGYAYRIHGGWRLSDWDHKPVADPYVVARVIRSLRAQEGVRQAPVKPEEPKTASLDWDRMHYGLPQLIVED